MNDLNERIMAEACALQAELADNRRTLHRHPEIGFELPFTGAFVKEKLEEMGCEAVPCGKAGFTVLLGKPGRKTVLIRGDMDALPMQEEADVPYRSETPGQMHGCGHDMHTAMMLGAAKLLKAHESELEGQVKLMFQPAEEIMLGAKDMVEAGVLENPSVDAAFMLHVMAGLPFPLGSLILPMGGTGMASSDRFRISVRGKGGHGGMPSMAVDPITALANIYLALQSINAREISPGDYLVITPCTLHAGDVANVIPDCGYMEGTIRTAGEPMISLAKERISGIAAGIAASYRCSVDVTFDAPCPPMFADAEVVEDARTYLTELLGDAVLPSFSPANGRINGGGSEDFAFVADKVPSVNIFICAGNSEEGYIYTQHHPLVRFDDSVLYKGTASYVYFAMRWLEEHG